jgi:hypothetical protein
MYLRRNLGKVILLSPKNKAYIAYKIIYGIIIIASATVITKKNTLKKYLLSFITMVSS